MTSDIAGAPLDLVKSFEAIPFTGWTPCDPIIAAGPSSLVAMVTPRIVIFDKQGVQLFEQAFDGTGGFWGGQGASTGVAEPWVIFDPNSGRFIASAADFGSAKGMLYLAVSKNSTPTGPDDWYKLRIDRSGTHQNPSFSGVPTYPDYARVGVDGDAIYVTSVHFAKDQSITGLFSHAEIFAIEKAPLLADGSLHIVYDEPVIAGSVFSSIHPAVVFEPEPAMYFVQANGRSPDDKIIVHALANVLTAPVRTTSLVPVPAFDRPPNVPQLQSATLLDNIDARLMSAVVRNGSLWTAHAIRDPLRAPPEDAESVVRWYEFGIRTFADSGAALLQSGSADPGLGLHTWLPHINMDAAGNMALGFSIGGANQYAAIGYTARLASAPAGWTEPVRTARAGQGWYDWGGWGEYSGLAIDPDGCTFWLFNQYPTAKHRWQTFVGAFQVAPCPVPPVANAGPDQTVTDANNDGFESVMLDGSGSFDPDGGAIVAYEWKEGATVLGTTASINPILSLGAHVLTLTVTDDESVIASDTVNVTVAAPPANPLHCGDLDGSSANSGQKWRATVVSTIHDGNYTPVAGATVSIQWSGGATGTATGTASSNGQCSFTSAFINKQNSSVTFIITAVSHPALTSNPSANHDPDADSNGTSITVARP